MQSNGEAIMTVKEQLFQKLETLLPEEQEAVIQFVDFLQFKRNLQKPQKPQEISLHPLNIIKGVFKRNLQELQETNLHPRNSLKGLWADLPIDITEEEITEARQEMWDFSENIES
ncbi:hypothetical protein [Synechocystis sp. PCC 7509]|uniref:hypothetical protein n=1 Tax=Synechocystis sp. PCC 7509 TaxID=927677 RepID=UPI0002AC6517|nr:hypothetical protein [Synechocystis sp. PCC 7509]